MVFRAFEGRAPHLKSRDNVINLLEARDFYLEKNVEFKDCKTEVGLRDYTVDALATLKVDIEIDGKTHWSKAAIHKDKVRDLYFKTQHIPTLRLPQDMTYTDDLLMTEFIYQVLGLKNDR